MTLSEFINACPEGQCVTGSIATSADATGREVQFYEPHGDVEGPFDETDQEYQGLVDDLGVWRWNRGSERPTFRGSPVIRISAWYEPTE